MYYEAGGGDAIVYLHGSGSFTGFDFATAWVGGNRVIAPHHPGYGESGDSKEIRTIHDYVLHYLELFDQLGLNSVHLIGASLGGWIAAEIAVVRPDLVRSLSLVGPAGLYVADPPATDLFTIPPEKLSSYLMADPSKMARYHPAEPDVDFLTLRYRETISTARLLWEDPKGGSMLNGWLERLRMPVLILWGEKDRVRPPSHGKAWCARLPDAQLTVLPGTGHLALEENADTARLVADFVAAH